MAIKKRSSDVQSSGGDRKRMNHFAEAGLRAARWFATSQVPVNPPYWDANFGRFIYNRHLPSGATVLGLSWTQGRGIFTLLSAYEMTGDASLMVPVVRAAEYLKLLQIYDSPKNPRRQFAIRENMPLHWFSHVRDATEGATAFVYLYRVTQQEEFLRRAIDFAKWFDANGWGNKGWPARTVWLDRPKTDKTANSFQAGNGPFFYYLAQASGQRKYLQGLRLISENTVKRYVRADGAVVTSVIDAHHTSGEGVVLNDDGLMVNLLCAYLGLKDRKFLDVCLLHARWIIDHVHPPLEMLSALPCICNFMIQLTEITGEARYRDWAASQMEEHVLPLQVGDASDPMAAGAFRGEDEPTVYYGPRSPNTPKTDFITTRMTCYAALACMKLAGIVGPYYGATGWDRAVKKPKLLSLALD